MGIVGLNGVCIEEDKAVVSVFDHGLLYGLGLFETFRTYNGVPFLLSRHLERLAEGCLQLGIRYQPEEGQVKLHVRELLEANGLADGYVRFSVSAGSQPLGLPVSAYTEPNIIVYIKPLPLNSLPVSKPLQLLKTRRNTPEGLVRLKSFHYMNNVLGRREMSAYSWAGGAEGLFMNGEGFVAEGIVSNLFFAANGSLFTPSLDTGILPGITRGHVLSLAKKAGMSVREGKYHLEELLNADEIFMTNSIQEIVPVHSIYDEHGAQVWTSRASALTDQIYHAYKCSITDYVQQQEEEAP